MARETGDSRAGAHPGTIARHESDRAHVGDCGARGQRKRPAHGRAADDVREGGVEEDPEGDSGQAVSGMAQATEGGNSSKRRDGKQELAQQRSCVPCNAEEQE